MSDNGPRRPIVIRRKRVSRQESHGTWKIAYADFMTAMMAFFLVMWLLGGLSNIEINQVSKYFRTPLKVALVGGDKSTASDSAIPGGGDDPTHSDGAIALTRPDAKNYRVDRHRLKALKNQLEQMIHTDPALNNMSSQLKIDLVPDGLRIQIFDNRRRPMFELGRARIEPYIKTLLAKIAPRLNELPNKITLTGHTDDLRYSSKSAYSNWELSSDRANAARRALIAGGMAHGKLLRVIGAAATLRLPGDAPGAAVNRRISILVLNDKAQRRIESQGRRATPKPDSKAPTPDADTNPFQAQAARQSRSAPLILASGLAPADGLAGWPAPGFGMPKVSASAR